MGATEPSPAPLEICHVITSTRVGGAEVQLLRFLEAAPRERARHQVISLEPLGELAPQLQATGARVSSLELTPGPGALLPGIWALAIRLRQQRPQVVQTWMYHADLLGLLASWGAGRPPVVWSLRCSDLALSPATARVVRLCARLSPRARAVVANSQQGRDWHQELGYKNSRLRVIPNGFDCQLFRPDAQARQETRSELGLDEGHLLVGHVARLDPAKDHPCFLAAAAQVASALPQARFVLMGSGITPDNPALAACQEPPLAGRCFLLGRRDDVPRWLAGMDLFVSSSMSEGFPGAMGEAMACGLPVATTAAGDSALLLGPAGRVCPVGQPSALAQAMLELLSLPAAQRQALGARGRARILEHYAAPVMVRAYLDLYGEIIS